MCTQIKIDLSYTIRGIVKTDTQLNAPTTLPI